MGRTGVNISGVLLKMVRRLGLKGKSRGLKTEDCHEQHMRERDWAMTMMRQSQSIL